MSAPHATVVDIGMSNTWSVLNAFRYLGASASATADPAVVADASVIVLPGVGSFRRAMDRLRSAGLADAISTAAADGGRKILGICLGMQLLGVSGTEDGLTDGLGLIPGTVDAFTSAEVVGRKIPHVGFNSVEPAEGSVLFDGVTVNRDFYFVHSYRMLPVLGLTRTSIATYGIDFAAAYEHGNVYATQFHPEKSQAAGLRLLKNFMDA